MTQWSISLDCFNRGLLRHKPMWKALQRNPTHTGPAPAAWATHTCPAPVAGMAHPGSTPAKAIPGQRDVPTAEMDAYIEEILSEMPGEWPIPAPRRRRPIPAPRTRWVISSFLWGWQMDVPQGHPHGADPRAFLEGVRPQIRAKLEEEIKALNGIKFQLALKVQFRKDNPDGSEEYTDPVLRHKQEAILQNSEIQGALNQAFPTIQETLEKWTQRGSGWVVDRVEVLWLNTREDLLEPHKPDCRGIGQTAVQVEMPEEGKNKLAFQNHHKQLPAPYIIYADFEALTTKVEGPELDPTKSNTQRTQHHKACSYSFIVVRCDGQTEPPVEYRCPNAAEHFLEALQEEERKIKGVLANPQALRMMRGDWHAFRTAETCHVCNKPLKGDAARDHCHITGKYRGAAHTACNLKLRLNPLTTTIPVVFHNLQDYDSQLLMQAISKAEGRVSCIPNNTEKYISFSLGQLRFIDSAQFLLASLDKLVVANPPEAFRITAQHEPNRERRELLTRKSVYPYEYMDTWDRFTEPKLPPKEVFYSKLTDAHISDEDYVHAQKVWETFGCKTLGDYNDLYCRTDILLLADVFETFRRTCQEQYGLDPAHYYTSPGLSWDALLKKTGIELELLTDYDQHLFIEKGMRGGISMASKCHARANNPLVQGYDPGQPSSHILYLDANNLYGWAMSQYLPTRGFRWVAAAGKNYRRATSWRPQGLHTWGGPGVPRRPTRRAQFISAGTGARGGSEGVDVGLSAGPPRRWGGANRGGEAGPKPPQQGPLRASLSESAAVPVSGLASDCGLLCPAVRQKPLDGAIHPNEHRAPEEGRQRLREGPLQVDEQLGLREDHGEPAEAGWCETGAIPWGGQAQAPHRQPSIRSGQYLRWRLGSYPGPQEPPRAQSPGVRGEEHSGSLQAPDVQLLLQAAPGAVRGSLSAPLHRHQQPPPRGPDRGCLQGHGLPHRALRHLRLPTGAPTAQHRQQKGVGEDEGRVYRAPHCRIYLYNVYTTRQ